MARIIVVFALLFLGCEFEPGSDAEMGFGGPLAPADHDAGATIPLTDLGPQLYLDQFQGGLYENGLNEPPADHALRILAALQNVAPINGRIVLVSVGMSNTSHGFCCEVGITPNAWTFMGQAATDPTVNHETLVIVNGARAQQVAKDWDEPTDAQYDTLRYRLEATRLSESDVQVVWVKLTNDRPNISLPGGSLTKPKLMADAYRLEHNLGMVARAMRARWPNLRIVYLSSRTYGGYASSPVSPEPYAYETGFSVKWVIQAQIEQARTGFVDDLAGDLSPAVSPVLLWGPYLWADGAIPRRDGLSWPREDYESDGLHPSTSGETKVGALLLEYFKLSPFAHCWFLAHSSLGGGACP
jgi:hypothetical protein